MGETWSMIWTSRKAILNSFFSENCHYQDSDTGNDINDLSRQYSSAFVLFSIEISFEEFKVIMAETYKFDYRAKIIGTALFPLFGLTRVRSHAQKRKFLNRILPFKWKLLDSDLVWRTETSSFREIGVWSSRQNKNNKRFVVSDYRDHDGSSKRFGFSTESSSKSVKFSNEALLEKINLKVVEEKIVWKSIKTFIKSTFNDSKTSRALLQRTKSINNPPDVFRLESFWLRVW